MTYRVYLVACLAVIVTLIASQPIVLDAMLTALGRSADAIVPVFIIGFLAGALVVIVKESR